MTQDKKFKRKVRERMEATGESYTTARLWLLKNPPPRERENITKPWECVRCRKTIQGMGPKSVPPVPEDYPFCGKDDCRAESDRELGYDPVTHEKKGTTSPSAGPTP